MARRTLRLVCAVLLVAQLHRVDASNCGLGEYPIGAECCPMCAAGLRVLKHCTANSSTTCVPCVGKTYTDHPNGLEYCKSCKLCDKGANLVVEAACTYTKNTVCGCLPDYFCSYVGPEDCEFCQPYTVCFPDGRVKERGTETTDNVCEACPPGTSSSASTPYNCTSWPKPEEEWAQGKDKNLFIGVAIVCSVVVAAGAVLIYTWQRRKRKRRVPPVQESGSGQPGQALMLTMETADQTTIPVQEIGADPEAFTADRGHGK